MVSADNLGGNSLFGFVESFRANKPCKVCTGSKEEFQSKFTEEHCQLCSKQEHSDHVEASARDPNSCTENGVKKDCVLNTLRYYHITNNFCPDVMNDILEGIAPMELKLVLRALIFEEEFFLHWSNSTPKYLVIAMGLLIRKTNPAKS